MGDSVAERGRRDRATSWRSGSCRASYGAEQRLPSERRLALEFKASRPMVREALRSLTERGLIRVEPARGAFVRSDPVRGGGTPGPRVSPARSDCPPAVRDAIDARERGRGPGDGARDCE